MENSALNYEELCRLCASYESKKISIFSERGRERKLKDKITTCLPFDVSEDDLLPKSLCYPCIHNLENFYDFRRGCIDARSRLENVIQEVLSGKVDRSVVKKEDSLAPLTAPEDDIVESNGEEETPDPTDFLEACLGESPRHTSRGGGEASFQCKVCHRQFSSKSSLTIHAKHHRVSGEGDGGGGGVREGRGHYSCYVCDKVFSSKGHLALHSKVHISDGSTPPSGPNRLYSCDLCPRSYSGAKHLWGHVSSAHKGHPALTCTLCQKTFSSISNLKDHKRCKHKNDSYAEQVCISPVATEDDPNFEKTEDTYSDSLPSSRRKSSKPRKIERDGNTEAVNSNTESKSQPVSEQNINRDRVQRKKFYNTSKVKQENLIDNEVFSCTICQNHFQEPQHLSRHMLEVHGYDGPIDFSSSEHKDYGEELAESMMESETVFCCEICVREFSDRASLWLHLLYTHKSAASKACGVCLKICENTESLLQHVESAHPKGRNESKVEQKRYMCQVCARQHDSRKKLVTHAKIHKLVDADGKLVDPETVVVQNTEFYSDGYLPHPSDDNYLSCEHCFRVFESDIKLMKHKRIAHRDSLGSPLNSGGNNFYFACEICGLSHNSRSERWKHVWTAHAGEASVTCEVPECGKVFSTSALKTEHASHHQAQGQFPNTCEVCGKMWKTRVEYWKHMMGVHPDYLPFICGVCLKVFCNLSNLVSHVRETHWPLLGGDYCCDICGRPYSKVAKMSRHRKVHYVPGNPPELQALLDNPKVQNEPHFLQQPSTFACDLCENSTCEFESIELLGKHRQDIHSVLPCDLCTKYYGRTSHLWKHVNKIHKGHPEVTCPTCQRTSASKSHLASHIAKHHRTVPREPTTSRALKEPTGIHTCEKCSKIFRKESLVKKHIVHCKGPRPTPIPIPPPVNGVYQCDRCEKSFSGRNLLYKHLKHSHVFFHCELCEVKTNSRTELYKHVCTDHFEDPNVKCDKCDKILRCKADLDKHRKGHNINFQLHWCKFCAELVTSKFKLRRHLKANHGEESKFLCALCLEDLPGVEELIAHVEANHKANLDRRFTCQICGKPCQNKSKYFEHIKYHGANFSPCKICLKIFPSKEELDSHLENHPSDSGEEGEEGEDVDEEGGSVKDGGEDVEGEEPDKRKPSDEEPDEEEIPRKKSKLEVECSVCNEIFYSKMALRRHLKSAHNIKPVIKRHSNDNGNSEGVEKTNKIAIEESDKSAWESIGDSDKSFMHQLGLMPETKLKQIRKVYDEDESPVKCDLCGKVWTAKKHLWQHLIRYHKKECGRTCGVCLKLCPDYPCLSAHLAVEHPDNFDKDASVLVCRVCGKYHNAKSKLLSHATIHFGHEERAIDPKHHCLICQLTFDEFSQFRNHIQIDHNITNGKSETNRKWIGSNSASVDKRVIAENHSLKKLPFHTCDVCSLVFASEVGLTNHKRIHENSDNFKCGQCGEVFQSAENLCTHKLQKHKGTEFVCADCKSNFSAYNLLIEHNKLCKMKLKNMNENSDDDELLLDDDMEDLETSYGVNDTIMSSESDDLDKSEFPDENDLESDDSSLSDGHNQSDDLIVSSAKHGTNQAALRFQTDDKGCETKDNSKS